MTIAKDFAAKASVAFVATAMIFSMIAPVAQAQSATDLQKMIDDLMKQVAALQGQGGTSTSVSSGICPFVWTRDLKSGTTGADVMKLQQFLNSNADTRVAAIGAGSVGMETQYMGPATAAAVSKFQVMHRAAVLTPNGLQNPTGFFGPSTRAKANSLCITMPEPDEDEDTTTPDEDEEVDTGLSGEASLFNMEIDSAADDQVEEGAEDAELAVVTVEFNDGDAMITRMDVSVNTAITGTDAWDVLESLALFVDGDEVARVDASNKDDYTNETAGTLRFSGLDIVAMEDEELEITIAATLQGSIDSADQGAFTVEVENLRFIDGSDVTDTVNSGEDFGVTQAFTIENAGTDDELIVKTSTADPDGKTFQLETDTRSSWENVFTFDLDTDDSTNDIDLTTVVLTVYTPSTSTYNVLVDDAELVIGGKTISSVVVTNGTTATATLTFDVDSDVIIEAGDRAAAKLMLKFKSLASGNEGATVYAAVTSAQADLIVAEGVGGDDLAPATQISGSATGDVHTLRTAGVDVKAGAISAVVTTADGNTNDYATYKISFDVTAFNQDVYISTNPATSTAYALENGAGVTATTGARTVNLSSTGSQVGNSFEITEGSTKTITLEVTYVPGVTNTAARLNLNTLVFGSTSGTPTGQSWTASPDESYRTSVVTVVN